ncbi:MAG: hypothetical protein ACTSYU_13430 [Promethearchaeota archaeon]
MPPKIFSVKGKEYSLDYVLIQVFEGLQSERVQHSFLRITNSRKFPVRPSRRSINNYGKMVLTDFERETSEMKRDIIRQLLSREFYSVIKAGYPFYVAFLPETLIEITMDHLLEFLDLVLERAAKENEN